MENHQQGQLERETPPVILQGHGGDNDNPGQVPDEIVPDQGDQDHPDGAPLEETPGGGDMDQPGEAPQEIPAQPTIPSETPPPD